MGYSITTPSFIGIFSLLHEVKKLVWPNSVSFQLNPIYEIISYFLWFRKYLLGHSQKKFRVDLQTLQQFNCD